MRILITGWWDRNNNNLRSSLIIRGYVLKLTMGNFIKIIPKIYQLIWGKMMIERVNKNKNIKKEERWMISIPFY